MRGPQPAGWSGDRGMAAGITDTVTGTLRLGARDYDPVTGAFTQPDPLLDVSDPLQWNPYSYGTGNPVDRPDPSGLAYCTSTACGGGTTGSMNETGGSLHETHRPSRGGGSSGSSGSRGGGGGGSRYHGGGYNGGGHRATRYTTPRRATARHAGTKARYRTPTRPATVTPVPPAPDPYLTCRACTFIWVIPIAVGITEAAIDAGITIGIGISIGILADKIKERIHTAIVHKNESEPRSVDDILGDLPRGDAKKSKSYEVDSEEELEDVWKQLTEGEHTDAHWRGHAEGESIRRSDGVEVGIRNHSKSGGSTIDIRIPGESKMRKIHVRRR
ncbi:RHS repeat-associated core domain-containing protein [Acidipropionibacterium acidipropionici]|uniref:RHS repeat-associated core domain-containing protein n=1 Tax=Acidipropionibacterium acidipropionici TaxID=1748 RepID=UPI0022B76274|nr:RHS repeat-associated core domain-containing protein [Acidipropionibacterium acidipropionici]